MKRLAGLHRYGAQPYEGVIIYGTPEIVKPRTYLPLIDFIGHRVIRIDDHEVVSGIDRLPVAVLPGRHPDVQHEAVGEHARPDLLGRPLHANPSDQVCKPTSR